jgi:hypothetical protein
MVGGEGAPELVGGASSNGFFKSGFREQPARASMPIAAAGKIIFFIIAKIFYFF